MSKSSTNGRSSRNPRPTPRLPLTVQRLPPALGEIAAMVYRAGELTAPQIQDRLPRPVSNSAIRTMLTRLMEKKIVARKLEGNKYYYFPVRRPRHSEMQKLRRLCLEQFDGSLTKMAVGFAELLRNDQPELVPTILGHFTEIAHVGDAHR